MTNKQPLADNEKNISHYLAEYITASLNETSLNEKSSNEKTLDKATGERVEAWLDSSSAAKKMFRDFKAILNQRIESEVEVPQQVADKFYQQLSDLEKLSAQSRTSSIISSFLGLLYRQLSPSKLIHVAAVLMIGIGIGYLVFQRQPLQGEVKFENLTAQVKQLEKQVLLAQLGHNNTGYRLQAVRQTYALSELPDDVAKQMFLLVEKDVNPHVRVAAAMLLLSYYQQTNIEQNIESLYFNQSDSKVLLMMLKMLKDRDPEKASALSQKLIQQQKLTPFHQQLAQEFI